MSAPGLNWLDPDAVRAWVKDVDTLREDLVSVAKDRTDPPGKRVHGRKGARRLIKEANRSLRDQIAYALAGLPEETPKVPEVYRPAIGARDRPAVSS